MVYKREKTSDENKLYASIKWLLTAVSGILTTTLIFMLGPVSP
jgi:hypothetical protein